MKDRMPENPFCDHWNSCPVGCLKEPQQPAQEQMVKVSWLYEPCPHSEPLTLTTRRECDECMEELLDSFQEQK